MKFYCDFHQSSKERLLISFALGTSTEKNPLQKHGVPSKSNQHPGTMLDSPPKSFCSQPGIEEEHKKTSHKRIEQIADPSSQSEVENRDKRALQAPVVERDLSSYFKERGTLDISAIDKKKDEGGEFISDTSQVFIDIFQEENQLAPSDYLKDVKGDVKGWIWKLYEENKLAEKISSCKLTNKFEIEKEYAELLTEEF